MVKPSGITKTQADIEDPQGRVIGKVHLSLNQYVSLSFKEAKALTEVLADVTGRAVQRRQKRKEGET